MTAVCRAITVSVFFVPTVGFGAWQILATPGIPPDRDAILRQGFGKNMKDPDFLAEAKKPSGDSPTSGADLQALAREVFDQLPEVVEWLKKLLAK